MINKIPYLYQYCFIGVIMLNQIFQTKFYQSGTPPSLLLPGESKKAPCVMEIWFQKLELLSIYNDPT